MKKFALFLLCLALSSSSYLYAEEMVKFDFQQYVAEGAYEFYRIEIDLKNKSGALCYFDNDGFVAGGGKIENVSQATWSRSIDLSKVKHACSKLSLYNSQGWFMTDIMKYGDADYTYFFIGSVKKEKIDGTLYQFRDYRPSGSNRSYKTTDQIRLSVVGVSK